MEHSELQYAVSGAFIASLGSNGACSNDIVVHSDLQRYSSANLIPSASFFKLTYGDK